MKTIVNEKGVETKIFAETVEDSALEQVTKLCNSKDYCENRIRIMPDCHSGKGCVIGTTIALDHKVDPNLVGVDVGCGMLVKGLGYGPVDYDKLDSVIRRCVPSGFNVRGEVLSEMDDIRESLNRLSCLNDVDVERTMLSIGTLGGGNHFIEVDLDDDGFKYLVIHSGSRNLGVRMCSHYHKIAVEKSDGSMPKSLASLYGDDFSNYMHDMAILCKYASRNRRAIANVIFDGMGIEDELGEIETVHNYIDTVGMILRKGAVGASLGEMLIIPMNMRDGSLICKGKGNPDWNYSAPHGAGRLMSRKDARKRLSMEDFRASMSGIASTSVCEDTIDESPMAYKPMEEIIGCIGDTVDVEKIIRPEYNFKASEKNIH